MISMNCRGSRSGGSRRGNAVLLSFAALTVLLEIIPTILGGYGYFIDEWYYIACANRLAFGFVDHPPLAPLLLNLMMSIAGSSLVAIRILPALAGGVTVYVTGLMARDLGGGVVAQGVAALAVIIAPGFLLIFGFYSMNAFELLLWVLCSWTLLRILRGGDTRLWLLFGALFGIGLENKHTILLFGAGVAAALLLSPARRQFLERRLWIGVALAAVLLMPNLLWQASNGWPSLEFYANQMAYKNIPTPPLKGILNQLVLQNPASFPVWLCGLLLYLFAKEGRQFRALGFLCSALFVFQIASESSRPDRIAGMYPLLCASGGVAIEAFVRRTGRRWLMPALFVTMALCGILLAPVGLPLLGPEALADYCARVGIVPRLERDKTSPLPQWFADRFEWESFVGTIKDVYDRLPPGEKDRAAIFAPSYGHAGALEYYAPSLGLPRVVCNHNSYYMWCAGKADADVLIAVGARAADLRTVYARVDSVGIIRGKYGMSWRNNMTVYLAKDPTTPLNAVWDRIKHYE
jgi:hypothetical protein